MGPTESSWERIVPYWRVLEMIEPREIPRPTSAQDKRQPGTEIVEVTELRPGQPVPSLPWQAGHRRYEEQPRESRYGSVWRHTVYAGVFRFEAVRKELARELRFELDEDYAGVHNQESALFAFAADASGRLIDNTGAFSSCAWGAGRFGRLRKGDPGGTDPSPGHRARDWVGASPNLLNVAVSRARRRLYVIGSYSEWHDAPNFGVFATTAEFPRYDFSKAAGWQ